MKHPLSKTVGTLGSQQPQREAFYAFTDRAGLDFETHSQTSQLIDSEVQDQLQLRTHPLQSRMSLRAVTERLSLLFPACLPHTVQSGSGDSRSTSKTFRDRIARTRRNQPVPASLHAVTLPIVEIDISRKESSVVGAERAPPLASP